MTNLSNDKFLEIVAYESLWLHKRATFKALADLFARQPDAVPSNFVAPEVIMQLAPVIENLVIHNKTSYDYNCLLHKEPAYPRRLRDAREPLELLYYSGDKDLLLQPAVAVIGTRHPTAEGLRRTARLVNMLVADGIIIVSGLARGIDTQAHQVALNAGGRTVAVIGTPLDQFYPKENIELQNCIAREHLLLSQVPFYRYRQQHFTENNAFFPERNKTMVALSEATVIVEAGDRSGTLIAARAALEQGRKLFIMESCFQNRNCSWPAKLEEKGAIRLRMYEDLKSRLKAS